METKKQQTYCQSIQIENIRNRLKCENYVLSQFLLNAISILNLLSRKTTI